MNNLIDDVENGFEDLSYDFDHINNFITGFESIVSQMKEKDTLSLTEMERYTLGVFQANGIKFNQHMGSENFIVDAAKKLYEMIINMLKKIKDFFFNGAKVVLDRAVNRRDPLQVLLEGKNNLNIIEFGTPIISNNDFYKIIKNPDSEEKTYINKLRSVDRGSREGPEKWVNYATAISVTKLVKDKKGLAEKVKNVDINKAVSNHVKYVSQPDNVHLVEKTRTVISDYVEKFNSVYDKNIVKIHELKKYFDDHKEVLPQSIYNLMAKNISENKKFKELDDVYDYMFSPEIKTIINIVEIKENEIKKDESALEANKCIRKIIKDAAEIYDSFEKYLSGVDMKKIESYVYLFQYKLELIINCIDAEIKK